MAIDGGVEVIGTFTQKNGKNFPIVMAEDVGVGEDRTLMDVIVSIEGGTVNSASASKKVSEPDIAKRGAVDYLFGDIENTMEIRVIRSGSTVECVFDATLNKINLTQQGEFKLPVFHIDDGFKPSFHASALFIDGNGNYGSVFVEFSGEVYLNIYHIEKENEITIHAHTSWITEDSFPEEG